MEGLLEWHSATPMPNFAKRLKGSIYETQFTRHWLTVLDRSRMGKEATCARVSRGCAKGKEKSQGG